MRASLGDGDTGQESGSEENCWLAIKQPHTDGGEKQGSKFINIPAVTNLGSRASPPPPTAVPTKD